MTPDDASLEEILVQRYSCRAFLSDPLPQPTLDRLLTLSQHTAAWCNTQPWRLYITRPPATDRLREALHARAVEQVPSSPDIPWPREYRGVYLARRREAGYGLYNALGIERNDKRARLEQMNENFRFFGAPHAAIVTSDEALGAYGAVDCGGYVANFMNVAHSLGLGSVAQAAIAHHSPFVRDLLGIPDDRIVVCGMSFGFPDNNHPVNRFRTTRVTLGKAVIWIDE